MFLPPLKLGKRSLREFIIALSLLICFKFDYNCAMLFNSYEFIFLFLIPVFVIYFIIEKHKINFLILASVVFYAQWSLEHLLILVASILLNYGFALFCTTVTVKRGQIKLLPLSNYLFIIIVLNLFPLVYYKYSNFLNMSEHSLVLPLAISFFTFQQIAFQVDLYKGKIKLEGMREYLFFILFFPQLIAGPIVHYHEIISQIQKPQWLRFNELNFKMGIILFSVGLFKKVVLADSLARMANGSFSNDVLSSYEAWSGLFAYSFQIYFDFSGYADMAIGLGLLFGLRLPINFDSPYKSRNIVEFWRNWHVTLSNFLRDYIYIPLGGNRIGAFRSVGNILVTMLIGGIWHGAGWNFLLWGFLHGVLLAVVHLYKGSFFKYISVFVTFLSVTLLWVLFRAENFDVAVYYYKALFSFREFTPLLDFNEFLLFSSLVIVWFLPNSMKFVKYFEDKPAMGLYHAFIGAIMFFISLKMMALAPAQTFVYFNF